jgi:hypothetical protein
MGFMKCPDAPDANMSYEDLYPIVVSFSGNVLKYCNTLFTVHCYLPAISNFLDH